MIREIIRVSIETTKLKVEIITAGKDSHCLAILINKSMMGFGSKLISG
jgi:hypothetical protein